MCVLRSPKQTGLVITGILANCMLGSESGRRTTRVNSQAVDNLVLKFGVSSTVLGKIRFFWKASESRI